MNTKVCPNCNAEVPAVANLCKHCFHDFNVPPPKRKSPLFPILFLAVGAAIVSAGAFGFIRSQTKSFNITIDEETKSFVFTTKYTDHTEADRVYFKDVTAVEYKKNTQPRPFEVAVLTKEGDRYIYQQSGEPLDYQANQLAEMLGKPLSVQDNYEMPGTVEKK